MVSYLSTGVLIEKENECSRIEIPAKNANDFGLFIINSKIERRTAPLVEIFKEKLKTNSEFSDVVHSKLIPLNNEIIQCYIQNDAETGILKIKELSRLQYKNFKEMIPPAIDQLWKQGLDSGAYTMKLCGAGGGGFFLGFGNAEQIHDYEIIRFG